MVGLANRAGARGGARGGAQLACPGCPARGAASGDFFDLPRPPAAHWKLGFPGKELAKVILIGRDQSRRVFPLGERIGVGRDWANDIQLLDVKVSRNHARLVRSEGRYRVQDLGSHNGTFVNDEKVSELQLASGDRIRIGDNVLVFEEENRIDSPDSGGLTLDDDDNQTITFTLHGDLKGEFLQDRELERDHDLLRKVRRDLTTLLEISNVLNTERDRRAIFEQIADRIAGIIRSSSLFLMEISEIDGERRPELVTARKQGASEEAWQKPSKAIIRRVIEEGRSMLVHDASTDERFVDSESVVLNRLRSVICVPLRSRDSLLGLIYVTNDARAGVFTRYDLQLLTAIGIEAGIALENRLLFEDLENLFLATIEALAATIDAKDGDTAGHSRRVADNAVLIAREMGLKEREEKDIFIGGILHDIGKIGIPDNVLKLPGSFSIAARQLMQRHPVVGAEILRPIPRMRQVASMVRYHHEWYNGKGYPDGLRGEEIPLTARIIAVSDAFDAITSTRIYRTGRPAGLAREILHAASGEQFDPQVIEAFMLALDRGEVRIWSVEGS